MEFRYPAALALTLAVAATPVPSPAPGVHDLYSQRALRRAKIILQLKLLELRAQHLERVRRAIERRLPVDQLLKT